MYGERQALKTRLEELNHAEERTMRFYQEERERIYERLRKLDDDERFFQHSSTIPEKNTEVDTQMVEALPTDTKEQIPYEVLSKQLEEAKEIIDSLKQIQTPESIQVNEDGIEEETENSKKGVDKNRPSTKRTARTNKNVKVQKNDDTKLDYAPLYKMAVEILKQHTASVQAIEIKKEIQERTGIEISNMTNFMARLMKNEPLIEKPYRGQYLYKKEKPNKTPENSLEESSQQLEDQESESQNQESEA